MLSQMSELGFRISDLRRITARPFSREAQARALFAHPTLTAAQTDDLNNEKKDR
jgi:hypothetical protein